VGAQPVRQPATEVGVDAAAGKLLQPHRLRALVLGGANLADSHTRDVIDVLHEQPAAAVQRRDKLAQHGFPLGQMLQQKARMDQGERPFEGLAHNVVLADLQVGLSHLGQRADVEVRRHDVPGRAHRLGQPAGDGPAAGAHLQAAPALRHAQARQQRDRPLIQQLLRCLNARPRRGVKDVLAAHMAEDTKPDEFVASLPQYQPAYLGHAMTPEMREIAELVRRWTADGERVALATVVRAYGSAPRREGAKMIVSSAGRSSGSVSGGCVEADVILHAQQVLETNQPRLIRYGITDEQAFGVGLSCGGNIEVFVEPLVL